MNDEYSARPPGRRLSPATLGLALALVLVPAIILLAIPAIRHWREVPPSPPAPLRGHWTAPVGTTGGAGSVFPFGLALAPDGRRLAFPATRDGHVQIYLEDLRTGSVTALPGTEGGVQPFWSPDGRRLGFFVAGGLRALDTETLAIADVLPVGAARGATWNDAGDLVIAVQEESGLTVRRTGGDVRALTVVDRQAGELAHGFPVFLADGRHVLYFVRASVPSRQGVWLTAIDETRAPARLTGSEAQALAVGEDIVFASDGTLIARRLDIASRQLVGPASVLGVGVGAGSAGELFATAAGDVMVFAPPATRRRELVWISGEGERLGHVGAPVDAWAVRVAPDGRRVLATVLDPLLRTLDVVMFDGTGPVPMRVSLSIDADDTPVWSPDGLRVAWVQAGRAVMIRGAGAVLPAETRVRFAEPVRVASWTPDGTALVVSRTMAASRDDLWLVPVSGGDEPRPLVETPFADVQGVVSPDGRWLAYASDESGVFEVYVEPFRDRSPEPATRERVTSGGGSDPRWSRTGRDLFFRRGSAIHVATPALGRGQDAMPATSMVVDTESDLRTFDVSPDGRRFLVNLPADPEPVPAATLVAHWPRPSSRLPRARP